MQDFILELLRHTRPSPWSFVERRNVYNIYIYMYIYIYGERVQRKEQIAKDCTEISGERIIRKGGSIGKI